MKITINAVVEREVFPDHRGNYIVTMGETTVGFFGEMGYELLPVRTVLVIPSPRATLRKYGDVIEEVPRRETDAR